MDVGNGIEFLEKAVISQQASLRFQVYLICGLIGLGMGAIVFSGFVPNTVPWKWVPTLGGIFVPTLSGLPLKEISTRKEKIRALLFLKDSFQRVQTDPAGVAPLEIERLEERFWRLVDISLGP
jgi:hypothetical protein